MNKRKLGKRLHLTVVYGGKHESSPGSDGDMIYEQSLIFTMRRMHAKGSDRPKGYYHDGLAYDSNVVIRWLWTKKLGHFAPEVRFAPRDTAIKCFGRIAPVLKERGRHCTPDQLVEDLQCMIVESVDDVLDDQGYGSYDDFRPIKVIGEPAMLTLARAAL